MSEQRFNCLKYGVNRNINEIRARIFIDKRLKSAPLLVFAKETTRNDKVIFGTQKHKYL